MQDKRVHHQVRYLGLVENIRVRRAGFCFRATYGRFLKRYKMLSPRTWPTSAKAERSDVKGRQFKERTWNDMVEPLSLASVGWEGSSINEVFEVDVAPQEGGDAAGDQSGKDVDTDLGPLKSLETVHAHALVTSIKWHLKQLKGQLKDSFQEAMECIKVCFSEEKAWQKKKWPRMLDGLKEL